VILACRFEGARRYVRHAVSERLLRDELLDVQNARNRYLVRCFDRRGAI
jgi:hypothetical protein